MESNQKPPFKIEFGYERSLLLLPDGTYFSAVKEAIRKWSHGSRAMGFFGTGFCQIIYELANGEFLLVEYRSSSPHTPVGRKITPEIAFQLLIKWEEPIPKSLEHIPGEIAARRSQPQPPPANRPLEHWQNSLPYDPIRELPIQVTEFRALALTIAEGAVNLVHKVRSWSDGGAFDGLSNPVARFLVTLQSEYLIDPNSWWGEPGEIPPRLAVIEELPWPVSMKSIPEHVSKLKELAILPLLLLIHVTRSTFEDEHFPTSEEVQNACLILTRGLPEIELSTIAIRKALAGVERPGPDGSADVAEAQKSEPQSQIEESSPLVEHTQDFLDEVATISEAQWGILSLMRSEGCDGTNVEMRWPTQETISSWLGDKGVTATLKANLSSLTRHKWLQSRRGNQLGGGYSLTPKGLRALRFRESTRGDFS